MSSRKDEKERLRQERVAQEEAAARRAGRTRRIQLIGAGALAVAIAAIVIVAVLASGGDEGGSSAARGDGAKPPAVQNTNLREAARAAGCEIRTLPDEGAGHVTEAVKYKSNPPTSGEHDPSPAEDGVYVADNPPDVEQSVHALEHGRILFQYRAGTPSTRIEQLESMSDEEVKGSSGYKSLVFQNQTDMPHAVAATSWKKMLSCKTFDDGAFDALRAFRLENVDRAPEFVP
jgi:hypothetical protein